MKRFFLLGLLMGLVLPTIFDSRADLREEIPFIPTPIGVVDQILELAEVKKADVVYDLGSGDGRIVIRAAKKYGVRAVGIEMDRERFNDTVLKPNQSAAGFLYFKLPSGVKKLENLRVKATPTEDGTADRLPYKLVLPTLDLSGAVATSAAGQTENSQP